MEEIKSSSDKNLKYQLVCYHQNKKITMNENHQKVRLSPPIERQQILNMFQQHGYPPYAMINQGKMYSIFESEFSKKKNGSLHKGLVEQIWSESEATTKGQISVNTIADIVLEAQKILGGRVDKLSGPGGMIDNLNKKIKEKDLELKQFAQYHGEDRNELNEVTKELINMQIQQKRNQQDLNAFVEDYESINGIFFTDKPRQYTQYLLPSKKETTKLERSNQLLTAFHINNVLFLLQALLISSLRLSFFPISVYLHSYYVLFFGVSDSTSFTHLVLHHLASAVSDLAFVVIFIMNKYEIMPIRHSNNSAYTIVLLIFLIITIALRVFVMILYMNLRAGYNPKVILYFPLMGQIFPPKKASPIEPSYGYYSQYHKEPVVDQPITPTHKDLKQSNGNYEVSHVQNFKMAEQSPKYYDYYQ